MSAVPGAVAFVIPSMRRGGAERQTLTLMQQLDPSLWRPVLVTLDGTGPYFADAVASGIDAVSIGTRSDSPLGAVRRLAREFAQRHVQVVVTSGFSAMTVGRVAARVAGVPVDIVAEHSIGDLGRGGWRRGVDAWLGRKTDAFTTVCKYQRDCLVERGLIPASRARVIYNGIDLGNRCTDRSTARSTLAIAEDAFVVGIVAALRPEKWHEGFIRAGAILFRDRPDARLVVVGDGPLRGQLESLVDDLAIGEAVTFTGDREDARSLLPALDVFALSSRVEAFPMSALEAMACGLPVVAPRIGGLEEMVRDGLDGFLVQPGDERALASAWVRLANDRTLRAAMGQRGRDRVAHEFTAGRMAREHEALFAELLESGRHRGMW